MSGLLRLVAVFLMISPVLPGATQAFNGAALAEQIGRRIPDDLPLTDEHGRATTLGALRGQRPMLLVPAYYHCPMLCGLVVSGLAQAVAELGWKPGERFTIATVSFDPRDTAADASRAQSTALSRFPANAQLAPTQWPFTTGSTVAVARFLQAIGMSVATDASTGQISHPAAVVVVTADGHVSRYLCGIAFPVRDLRLALLDAGANRSATFGDQALLFCYHYEAALHRYGFAVQNVIRLGAIGAALLAATCIALACRRRVRLAPTGKT